MTTIEGKFVAYPRIQTIKLGCCGEEITVDSSRLAWPWQPQPWCRGYQCQRAAAERHWPSRPLPKAPEVFMPRTTTEHPLGHVPDSFDALWNKVDAPQKDGVSYTKYRGENVKSDERNLRLAPNKVEYTQPVWLAFDPEHGRGERPDSFWGQTDIAASEVFSALIQFPEWSLAWFNGASAPNLTGYQLKYNGSHWDVPCLHCSGEVGQLELIGHWADDPHDGWATPTVREC